MHTMDNAVPYCTAFQVPTDPTTNLLKKPTYWTTDQTTYLTTYLPKKQLTTVPSKLLTKTTYQTKAFV